MSDDRRAILRTRAAWVLGYLAVLVPITAYGAVRFAALYPADSLTVEPELSVQYRMFLGATGVALAVCLGLAAAGFGLWARSLAQGLAALVVGGILTVAVLHAPPMVRFPEDQYPVAALWMMSSILPVGLTFVLATLAGRVSRL